MLSFSLGLYRVTGNGPSLPLRWMHLKENGDWYLPEESCGFSILEGSTPLELLSRECSLRVFSNHYSYRHCQLKEIVQIIEKRKNSYFLKIYWQAIPFGTFPTILVTVVPRLSWQDLCRSNKLFHPLTTAWYIVFLLDFLLKIQPAL